MLEQSSVYVDKGNLLCCLLVMKVIYEKSIITACLLLFVEKRHYVHKTPT